MTKKVAKRGRRPKAKPELQGMPDPLGRRFGNFPAQWDRVSVMQIQVEQERAAQLIKSGYGAIRW